MMTMPRSVIAMLGSVIAMLGSVIAMWGWCGEARVTLRHCLMLACQLRVKEGGVDTCSNNKGDARIDKILLCVFVMTFSANSSSCVTES